jgi:hypothetical protein
VFCFLCRFMQVKSSPAPQFQPHIQPCNCNGVTNVLLARKRPGPSTSPTQIIATDMPSTAILVQASVNGCPRRLVFGC